MGFINIFSYSTIPEDFFTWTHPQNNIINDASLIRQKIFNLQFTHSTEALTILAEGDVFSRGMFNCGQRGKCKQQCMQKYHPNCGGLCEKYYPQVQCKIKRKIKRNININDCFLILYDKYINNEDIEYYANILLRKSAILIVAEQADTSIPLIQLIKRYSSYHDVKQIFCCGNPLDWSHNYIGKNTKVLYRQ